MRGLSMIAFLAMIGLLFMNQTMCKDVQQQQQMTAPHVEVPDGVHPYEYAEGEERPEEPSQEAVVRELTWKEAFCNNQQSTIAQTAIAVLLLAAVRVIMTKG